jgi:hypothetical protein
MTHNEFKEIVDGLKGNKIPGTEVVVDEVLFVNNKNISDQFQVWEVNLWLSSDVLRVDENLFTDVYQALHEYFVKQDDNEFNNIMIKLAKFKLTGGGSKDVSVDILTSIANVIDTSKVVREYKQGTYVYPENWGNLDEKKLDSDSVDDINTVLQQLYVQKSRAIKLKTIYPKLLSGNFMITPDIIKYDPATTFYPNEPPIEINYTIPHYKFHLTSQANKHYKIFGGLNIEDSMISMMIDLPNYKYFYDDHPSFRSSSDILAFKIKCGKVISDHLFKYGIIIMSTHHNGPQYEFVGDKSINRPGLTWIY